LSTILIADDDLELADVIAFTLRRAGFDVLLAHDGLTALDLFDRQQADLIILDWGLPRLDGLEVCRQVRASSTIPIVMLTVRSSDDDVVAALDAGADEYVTKPFSPRQLVARIRAVLRRASDISQGPLHVGPLSLDLDRGEVVRQDQPPIRLTRLEARLLEALLQNADRVLSADSLIVRVWGPGGGTREMLKQLVHRLRAKIERDQDTFTLIETIPGIGYVLNTPPTQ
jgi:DNA-binding response OmpR family regulator